MSRTRTCSWTVDPSRSAGLWILCTSASARPMMKFPASHAEESQDVAAEVGSGVADLFEPEHPNEILERGLFVAVREARLDVRRTDDGLGTRTVPVDGLHEALLFSRENRPRCRGHRRDAVGAEV